MWTRDTITNRNIFKKERAQKNLQSPIRSMIHIYQILKHDISTPASRKRPSQHPKRKQHKRVNSNREIEHEKTKLKKNHTTTHKHT